MKLEIPERIESPRAMYDTTHRLALEIIEWFVGQRGPQAKKKLGINDDPHCMTMELLEKIVCRLPRSHCRVAFNEGHARLFSSGTYKILHPITQGMYLEALRQAGIIEGGPR